MPITKAKKKEILTKLEKSVKDSQSLVFVNFHGMTVANVTELRKKLTKEGIGYTVAKKTLMRKALETAGITGELPVLNGEVAIAYGADAIAPAREILVFQKKFDKKLSMLGGVFEKRYMNQSEIMGIATIPGREQLLGMFVNVINSPIQGFVVALDAIAKKKTS
ncbi:MAG: 50S ribosomal protein L10 [Candidatus Pacebacteria bacterium]|nr:50S ribosomal protein L10 [Candidatus Paceibacterota bacterium]MDD5356966.1 50S ribosomal protein L10 [Candidatus Paceibacterota bacterium]